MDPSKSLTWDCTGNSWYSPTEDRYNYKFNIDFVTPKVIERIYYENAHEIGCGTDNGIRHVDFYGTNSSSAFINFQYDRIVDLTLLWSGEFNRHVNEDVSDPNYILLSNSTPYRYYVLRILNNWGGGAGMGIRRLELQRRIYPSSSSSSTSLSSESSSESSSTEFQSSSSSSSSSF
jgi:hypothetical protein